MRLIGMSILVVAGELVAGCGGNYDYKLVVDNQTDAPVTVRTDRGDGRGIWVTVVAAHTRGMADAWKGTPDHFVELLNQDCTQVGAFVLAPDGFTYAVAGVDGVFGAVSPYNGLTDGWRQAGIAVSTNCGGVAGA